MNNVGVSFEGLEEPAAKGVTSLNAIQIEMFELTGKVVSLKDILAGLIERGELVFPGNELAERVGEVTERINEMTFSFARFFGQLTEVPLEAFGLGVEEVITKFARWQGQLEELPISEFIATTREATVNIHAMISGLEMTQRASQMAQVGAMLVEKSISAVGAAASKSAHEVLTLNAILNAVDITDLDKIMAQGQKILAEHFANLPPTGVIGALPIRPDEPIFFGHDPWGEMTPSEIEAWRSGGSSLTVNVDMSGSTIMAEDIEDIVATAMMSAATRGRGEQSTTG